MVDVNRTRCRRVALWAVSGVLAAAGAAGCGSSDTASGDAGGGGGGGGDAAAQAVKAANEQLAVVRKGRMTAPPAEPSPAAKNKNVWIIQSTAAAPSVNIPARAAQEAGNALGWKTTLYDAKGDPGNYTKGVTTAIANGAQGIVLIAIDCSYVKGALEQAKAKKIAVSEVYAFDCDDTNPGSSSLFSADLSFGDRYKSLIEAWQQWGSDTAAWIIANTGGKARPVVLHTDQIAVLVSYQNGFEERMAQCSSCKVINVNWNVVSAATPAALSSLLQNATLKNPEINSSMYGSTVTSGYNQAILSLGAKAKQMKVIAGLGLPDEFALIKANKGLNATTAWPQQWIAYGAMDSLNSVFNGKPTRDEGIGWQIIDNTNADQMPSGKEIWQGNDTFRDVYKKSWGVG
jgi:ribose transport system substrate-binding protein